MKVIRDTMCLVRANNVSKTENRARNVKHVAVGTDHRFACELARAIGRDRQSFGVLFRYRDRRHVAVYATARCEKNPPHTRLSHRFQDVVGEQRSVQKINRWLGGRSCNVGICSKMVDNIVASR